MILGEFKFKLSEIELIFLITEKRKMLKSGLTKGSKLRNQNPPNATRIIDKEIVKSLFSYPLIFLFCSDLQ